jgi:hypothetical protein
MDSDLILPVGVAIASVGVGAVAVGVLATLHFVFTKGVVTGSTREKERLRRLYMLRRDAAEYELVTGVALDDALPPRVGKSAIRRPIE